MKKNLIILCISLVIISCSKINSDSSTPVATNLKVKYEMIFSSPMIPFPSYIQGAGRIFQVTYIDSAGNGAQTYPPLTGTSWSQEVTVVSKTRPIDIGFETTPGLHLSAKGSRISNIYVNNKLWKTRTDSTTTYTPSNINYFTLSGIGAFYFSYPN